jgi:hypothetical protein
MKRSYKENLSIDEQDMFYIVCSLKIFRHLSKCKNEKDLIKFLESEELIIQDGKKIIWKKPELKVILNLEKIIYSNFR